MSSGKIVLEKKKNKGLIIGIIAAVAIAIVAAVITVYYFILLPQVQVFEALKRTLATTSESEIDEKYGFYDVLQGIKDGDYDIEVSDGDNQAYIRRNREDHKFIIYGNIQNSKEKDLESSIYVDSKTSILSIQDKHVKIDYTEDLLGKLSDNVIINKLNLDNEFVKTAVKTYTAVMEVLSATPGEGNSYDGIYKLTLKYFLGLDSEKCDSKTFVVNDKQISCRVYKIIINPKELAQYVQDCYELSIGYGEKINKIVKDFTGYTVDEIFDEANDRAEDIKDVNFYFAINSDGELISIYTDDISKKKINFELNFHGGKYLCDSFDFYYKDKDGTEFKIFKDDISKKGKLAVSYDFSYTDKNGKTDVYNVTYRFKKDKLEVDYVKNGEVTNYDFNILDYKKGKYIELKDGDNYVYVGTKTREIEAPKGGDTLDLLDANIISLYKFFKDISLKDIKDYFID